MIGGRSALLSAAGSPAYYGNWNGDHEDVSLLLRGYATTLLQIPADESPSPKTLTANGGVASSTWIKKYGDSSMVFDGANDFISAPASTDFEFGLSDFTIEAWVYVVASDINAIVAYKQAGPSRPDVAFVVSINTSNTLICQLYVSNNFLTASSSVAIQLGQWHHVAVVRSAGQLRCYVDGVGGTAVNANVTPNVPASRLLTVGSYYTDLYYFNGYIDDLRITKGVARYTSNFTPPAAELPANITDDPSYNSVSLLLRNGGASISAPELIDESPNIKRLSANGNVAIAASVFKYGASSYAFDGAGDYCISPESADFDFELGDFTIECWVNFNTLAGDQAFVSYAASTTATAISFCLERLSSNAFRCFIYSGSTLYVASVTPPAITTGTWYHVAGVRSSGQLTVYVNGIGGAAANANASPNQASNRVLVVGAYSTTSRYMNGYIDDLRITKGVARYTKNFLPPPAELPAI